MSDILLSKYESDQVAAIKKWKNEEPSVVTQAIGFITAPLSWMVSKIIPLSAIRGALAFSSSAAEWLTDKNDIIRDAGVNSISDLRSHDLEKSDYLANSVHNWAIGISAAEGGVAGAAGFPSLVLDIPAVIILALRTIHKIGLCYGFEVDTKEDRDFVLGALAASGANDMSEKVAALATLRAIEVTLIKQSFKSMAQTAAQQQIGKEAGIIAARNLAKQLGVNMTKRKALQAIPLIGAAVGASVNGWYINEVGWAARRLFQERWLFESGKVVIN